MTNTNEKNIGIFTTGAVGMLMTQADLKIMNA